MRSTGTTKDTSRVYIIMLKQSLLVNVKLQHSKQYKRVMLSVRRMGVRDGDESEKRSIHANTLTDTPSDGI